MSPSSRHDEPERPIRLVDRFLRVSVFMKILLANVLIAVVAGLVALLVTGTFTDTGSPDALPWTITVFVVAVLAVATVLTWVVVRLALSPLDMLAESAERVRHGNLSARVPVSPLADRSTRSVVVLFNRMMDTLQAGRRRQKELARRILDAEERERERIAHELYSGPAQTLAGVMVRLRLAARNPDRGACGSTLEGELRDEVAAALDEIRTLARRLRPPELGELGVRAALEAHARQLTEGRDIRVTVKGTLHEKGLHAETATVLFRILQEAVTNSVLHSGGRTVEVAFHAEVGRLVAEVRDDGRGFDPLQHIRRPESGLGINGMQERASYAGGAVTVASSADGGGTRVRIELPWRNAPFDADPATGVQVAAELGLLEQENDDPVPEAIA